MSIKLQLPKLTDLKPRITVIGVGGAGGNAVNNMIASGLVGVEYIVANTDAQALAASSAERRLQLGVNLTEGLGAGARPEIGVAAAEEALEDVRGHIKGAHMVFIAAGMGGGTGTGAAGVIARTARELGILTVGIVTKPFQFEGARRMRTADAGIDELKKYVDTLIVIPNQNLFRIANEKTTFADAFVLADQVLYSGIACIVDLILKEGLINLDFADVRTVMNGMGSAMMGTGEATGERRALLAAEEAIANPLLDDVSLRGARGVLLSIIGGRDMTLYEVDEAASRVRQEVDPEANIIVGATFDDSMGERIRVAIVASGMARPGGMSAPLTALSSSALHPGHVRGSHGPVLPPPRAPVAQAGDTPRGAGTAPAPQPAEVRAPRELWRAPGDVTIEEGFPPFGLSPPAGPPRTSPPPLSSARAAQTFSPAPPADVRRGARRLPELEDFPSIGQREFHAKTGRYADAEQIVPEAPLVYGERPPERRAPAEPERRGLLRRLVGARGRGRSD